MNFIRLLLQHKLNRDIAWTIGSFMVLAVSGIVINLVIAWYRDAASLGVFNQAYAVYIVASQVAAFGLHYSVLRHAAYYERAESERSRMLLTAAGLALACGAAASLVVAAASGWIGELLDSGQTGRAVTYVAAGLLLFPLNKVLLAYLNGLRRMKAYAGIQALRYLLIMLWVSLVSVSDRPFELSTLGFFVAELGSMAVALFHLLRSGLVRYAPPDRKWLRRHLGFGAKSLLAGMFVEINSRVDVLMIGVFLADRYVGIYSFAAMLVEGLYHVLSMVRINFNPVLVGAIRDGEWEQAKRLLGMSRRYGYPVMLVLATAVLLVFHVLTVYVLPEKGLEPGMTPLLILLAGLTLIAAYIPFDNLLLVSGHPGYQTMQHMTVVLANVLLNLLLVPLLGIGGAALATAASYLVGIGVLIYLVNRFLHWNLFLNRRND